MRNNARNGGAAAKTSTKTSDMPDTKYSIRTDDNGNRYVHITENQGIFDKDDEKDYKKIASDFMSKTYKNVTLPLSDYNLVHVSKTGKLD